jgi:hypothetical protein
MCVTLKSKTLLILIPTQNNKKEEDNSNKKNERVHLIELYLFDNKNKK